MNYKKYEIWDYCFDCGKALTENMKQEKDWFEIEDRIQIYPVCYYCHEKDVI